MNQHKFLKAICLSAVSLALGAGATVSAQAGVVGDLSSGAYYTYGNLNSYSLPIMAGIYDSSYGGGVGPGNPYYVASSPGAIKDQLVIYTGASGQDVTTNALGFDDAYQTPNGSSPQFASINGAINVISPGDKGGIANNDSNTWDANLLALKGFLAGGDPIFLFNNNDTNSDPDLAIWGKLWLTDGSGELFNDRYLYLSNEGAVYGYGGVLNGDASLYNPGDVTPMVDPTTGETDFVLSGSTICLDAAWQVQACDGTQAHKIDQNLGANQAVYAGVVPVLNEWLGGLFALDDTSLGQYTLHLNLELGCAPGWNGDCSGIKIDNGYEQLFLVSSGGEQVPEPNTIALAALGFLAGWFALRRQPR
jgi:PEP-CTERM motif